MKTIKERAKSYVRKVWRGGSREFVGYRKATELDFIAGAQSEHEELTRWHNPKKMPEYGKQVLFKIKYKDSDTIRIRMGWMTESNVFMTLSGDIYSEIIGWREIHE